MILVRKNKFLVIILLLFIIGISLVLGPINNASALDKNSVKAKAAYEGIWQCWKLGAYAPSFISSNYYENFVKNDGSKDSVKLPYGMTDATDNDTDCRQIMFGFYTGISGDELNKGFLPEDFTKTHGHTTDNKKIAEYFAGSTNMETGVGGIGYKGTSVKASVSNSGSKLIYNLKSTKDQCANNEPTISEQIIFPTIFKSGDKVAIVDGESYTVPSADGETKTFQTSCAGKTISVMRTRDMTYLMTVTNSGSGSLTIKPKIEGDKAVWQADNSLWGGFVDPKVEIYLEKDQNDDVPISTGTVTTTGEYILNWNSIYQMVGGLNTKNTIGYKLPKFSNSYYDVALTRQELYDLYKYYVVDILGMEVVCEGDADWGLYSGNTKINWKGHMANCAVYNPGNGKDVSSLGNPMYGVDSAESRHFTRRLDSVGDIASTLMDMGDLCDLSGVEGCDGSSGGGSDSGSNSTTMDDRGFCDEAVDKDGGIGAMQWILCPTLDNTTYTAGWIDEMTQKALEVDSTIYEPGSKLHEIWGDIRDIANVLMVLFFIVIVASQLTGRGIDNYGIKKMLPRLITMAIIVNLSYYICAIAIDASNIAGEELRVLFGRLGGDGSGETNGFVDTIMALFGVGATGAGTAAGAASLAATLGAGGWVVAVVIVVVLVLVVIVALVVLWAMLGARLIIIILCLAISPLAFATFILPNTQNLFKKWWELLKAALIIFPICGAVAGMSATLKKLSLDGIIGQAGNLIIIILPYLVFFLLPILLKQAIAALGKVGGALTALGTTVKTGAKNIGNAAVQGAKGTEAFKNRQLEVARRRQSDSSQRTINRLEELKRQQGGKLNDTDTRRLARAHEVQRKLGLEDQAARTILAEKDFANLPQKQLIDRWETAFNDGNTEEMDALSNVIASKGPGAVSEMAERLAKKDIFKDGDWVGGENGAMAKSFNALQANMLQNKTLATHMQNKAADAYQMISGGGFGKDNVRHNMDYHTKNNDMATQIKDWATQSSATLRRSAASGGLTKQMANDILNSKDPAIQSGILSDSGKKAALLAAANGYTGDWNDKDSIANFATQFEGGMDANYINRSAESVADEAWAENARRSGASSTSGAPNNNPSTDMNIDHSGNGVDEIPE